MARKPIQLPSIDQPMVNPDGTPTVAWYDSYFQLIYLQLGGPSGATPASIQQIANQALTIGTQANANATRALTDAQAAQNTANFALTTAQAAGAAAGTAGNVAAQVLALALAKANNLSDVANIATARANLGVAQSQLTFNFAGKPGAAQSIYIPITRPMTIAANLAGTQTWVDTVAFINAAFQIKVVKGGVSTPCGIITFQSGSQTANKTGAATTLNVGDALQCLAPTLQDLNLADVGISIAVNLA